MSDKQAKRILWIDDNPDRLTAYKDEIEQECHATVNCADISNKSIREAMQEELKGSKPSLILLDHVLDKAKHDDTGLSMQKGNTLAGNIRENWPSCPIVGITAANTFENPDFDQEILETYQYDIVIDADSLSDNIPFLRSIMDGFAYIQNKSLDGLLPIIGLEDEENDQDTWKLIKRSMPRSVTDNLDKPQYASRFFCWFHKDFYTLPGFLYDELWVATFLGIKEESFEKYSDNISEAKYDGVFQVKRKPRWWRHRLQKLIYSHGDGVKSSHEIAQDLFKISDEDHSKCLVSKKDWPDYVAFADESSTEIRHQVFRRYTIAHPKRQALPFYEEPRILEDEDA